jgi:hypothetical protein
MIALPDHGCCADPRLAGALPYGDLDAGNVATCAVRRLWSGRAVDTPGCGARVAVCHGCGLRTRVNGAQCPACGGIERPEVARHADRNLQANAAAPLEAHRSGSGATDVEDVSHARQGHERPSDTGPRRPEKAPSPRKPRQTRAAVKSSPEPTAPDLPLFK